MKTNFQTQPSLPPDASSSLSVVQRASDSWANINKQDSLYVRTSCVPSDVYDMPFSGARYSDKDALLANEDTPLCLTNKRLLGGTDPKHWLVMGREAHCTWDPARQYTGYFSYAQHKRNAAQALANNIKKQFDDADVPKLIDSFRTLAREGMPEDAHGFFRRNGYGNTTCALKPSPKRLAAMAARGQHL